MAMMLDPSTTAGEPDRNPPADRAPVDEHPGLPMPRRWWAIVAAGFGTSLLVIDGAIANVALPTIARDLGVTNGVVTSVVTVYQLVLVMLLLPFASLGDRIGHRTIFQYGQLLFMIASALCLLADNLVVLLALRALQAIGAAMALSVLAALLRQIYPARSLGAGLGINSVIVASSGALAPTLGGYIVGHFEWQIVFVAAAPFAIVSLLLGRALPDPEPRDVAVQWVSGGWSALTMLLVIGGLQMGAHGWVAPGVALALTGGVSAWLLVRRDAEATQCRVRSGRRHGKGLIASLEGIDDRDLAAALVGCEIRVPRAELGEAGQGQYFWSDLEGLAVETERGLSLGRIESLLETGANDVLVVTGERRRLIPFLPEQVVKSVDLAGGRVIVDWDPDF